MNAFSQLDEGRRVRQPEALPWYYDHCGMMLATFAVLAVLTFAVAVAVGVYSIAHDAQGFGLLVLLGAALWLCWDLFVIGMALIFVDMGKTLRRIARK